jgi:hypothetical protein
VRAGLDGEGAERIGRIDLEGGRLDARLFGVARVHDLGGVVVLLGPAQVHAHEHLGEVGSVDAAGSGADRDHRGAIVPLAVEQGLHLELADRLLQRLELGARLECALFVFGLVRQLDEHLEVVEARLDALHPRELGLAVAERARHLLGVVGVVPEVGRTGER